MRGKALRTTVLTYYLSRKASFSSLLNMFRVVGVAVQKDEVQEDVQLSELHFLDVRV